MTGNEYLAAVLEAQKPNDDELEDLNAQGQAVTELLRDAFKTSTMTIRYGGSVAKETLIRASYDIDIAAFFANYDTSAGETLEEIYDSVRRALEKDYRVTPKTSALRLHGLEGGFTHVDVVPGRFIDSAQQDVFLHRTSGTKERLKTNLDIQIGYIRGSGVTSAIKLMKLWRERNVIAIRTMALELVTIELLRGRSSHGLDEQLIHAWTQLRDDVDSITIADPANPTGNDLSEIWNEGVRREVSSVAKSTLKTLDDKGWEAVFGPVDSKSGATDADLIRAVAHVSAPTKPWYRSW